MIALPDGVYPLVRKDEGWGIEGSILGGVPFRAWAEGVAVTGVTATIDTWDRPVTRRSDFVRYITQDVHVTVRGLDAHGRVRSARVEDDAYGPLVVALFARPEVVAAFAAARAVGTANEIAACEAHDARRAAWDLGRSRSRS